MSGGVSLSTNLVKLFTGQNADPSETLGMDLTSYCLGLLWHLHLLVLAYASVWHCSILSAICCLFIVG